MIDLDEARAKLADSPTPAPWGVRHNRLFEADAKGDPRGGQHVGTSPYIGIMSREEDAEIAAYARNMLPEAIEEIAKLRARVDEMIRDFRRLTAETPYEEEKGQAGVLLAQLGTMRSEAREREDRIAVLRAALEKALMQWSDADAHDFFATERAALWPIVDDEKTNPMTELRLAVLELLDEWPNDDRMNQIRALATQAPRTP